MQKVQRVQLRKDSTAYLTHALWSDMLGTHSIWRSNITSSIKWLPSSDQLIYSWVANVTWHQLKCLVSSGPSGVSYLCEPGGPARLPHPRGDSSEGGTSAPEEDGGHPGMAAGRFWTSGRFRIRRSEEWRRDGDHQRVLEQEAILGLPGGTGMAFGQTTHR